MERAGRVISALYKERLPGLLLRKLFDLVAVLDLADEDLCRLEAGDKMLINDDCRVARDVAGNFLFPLLVHKAPETPHVNIMSPGHRVFNNGKKGLN